MRDKNKSQMTAAEHRSAQVAIPIFTIWPHMSGDKHRLCENLPDYSSLAPAKKKPINLIETH